MAWPGYFGGMGCSTKRLHPMDKIYTISIATAMYLTECLTANLHYFSWSIPNCIRCGV